MEMILKIFQVNVDTFREEESGGRRHGLSPQLLLEGLYLALPCHLLVTYMSHTALWSFTTQNSGD